MTQREMVPDFDTLIALHQTDADSFEAFRKQLLRQAVDDAPPARRPKLERLLCRIEAAREASPTPLDAAKGAFAMMIDSVHELRDGWRQAHDALSEFQTLLVIERVRQPNTSHQKKT